MHVAASKEQQGQKQRTHGGGAETAGRHYGLGTVGIFTGSVFWKIHCGERKVVWTARAQVFPPLYICPVCWDGVGGWGEAKAKDCLVLY